MCSEGENCSNQILTAYIIIVSYCIILIGTFSYPIIWFCRRKKWLCWHKNSDEINRQTEVESISLMNQLNSASIVNEQSMLNKNKDEPPSYESLFPNRQN